MSEQQANNHSFTFHDLTGQDVEVIMNSMNEQPSKMTRATMNKLEGQIVQQVMAAQAGAALEGAKVPHDPKPEV